MLFTITPQEDGLVHMEDDAHNIYTGIASGLPSKIFRTVDLGRLQNESGWIIDAEGRTDPWKITGVTEQDGQMIFYGPRVQGRSADPKNLSAEDLWTLAVVFQLVREKQLPLQGFFPRGWMITEESRVLIFPPGLTDFIRKSQPESVKQSSWYPFNHPDRKGTEGLAFTLGILAYYALSGIFPYVREKEEELAEEMRIQAPIPLDMRIPGLKEPIARVINASLSPKEALPSLKEWIKVLDQWNREGACEEVSEEEKGEQLKKLEELTAKRENKLGMRVFWRQKRTIIAAAAVAAVLLISLVSAPIRKSLEPPRTIGMGQEEVIRAYYGSFDTLDQEMMEDCIDKKAGKGDLNEVMNFFVTSRVRQGYEGRSGLLPADKWKESGSPLPEQGISVYGLTDLKITALGENRYRADYQKWIPGTPGEKADPGEIQSLYPAGYKVSDILLLEEQKQGNWLIVTLERSTAPL